MVSSQSELEAIHEGTDRELILETIGEQASELHEQHTVKVTCPCGVSGPLRMMRLCHFCEIFFCPKCSDDHFGEEP